MKNIERIILDNVKGNCEALLLFGSYSRGDQKPSSDIDVIQIVRSYRPSYEIGKLSFSVYTLSHLKKMAKNGSLFILHLINEAKVIYGNKNIISEISFNFNPCYSYSWYRKDLKLASKLMDVKKKGYEIRPEKYNQLSCFLLRSYLYSIVYEKNPENISFSVEKLASYFDDRSIEKALSLRYKKYSDHDHFKYVRSQIERFFSIKIINEYKTIDALIVNAYPDSSLTVLLGLRLINDDQTSLPYGEIEEFFNMK